MMTLPGRVTVATARLVALLELAEWGARSEAERLLVADVRNELKQMGEKFMAVQKGGEDAGNISRLDSGTEGAQSAGAGDGDGGGAGTEPAGPGGGVGGTG